MFMKTDKSFVQNIQITKPSYYKYSDSEHSFKKNRAKINFMIMINR